jgi:hypothetical protein
MMKEDTTVTQYNLRSCFDWPVGKLLLAFASTIILGSESCGTHDRDFLSHGSGSHVTIIF